MRGDSSDDIDGPAREPPVEEHESARAVARIARALPPVERAYAFARFVIMRQKLLALMNLVLPGEGRILDVGCGFGLFSAYFALVCPDRRMVGVDPSARRIGMARIGLDELHIGRQRVALDRDRIGFLGTDGAHRARGTARDRHGRRG